MPTTEKIVFWNAENFFGTTYQGWSAFPDKRYDEEYYRQPDIFATRVARLRLFELNYGANVQAPIVSTVPTSNAPTNAPRTEPIPPITMTRRPTCGRPGSGSSIVPMGDRGRQNSQ